MIDPTVIITPALISTAITAILAPVLFHALKRRDDLNKRNFEIRYAEYKKYLQTLEDITASTRLDFEQTFQIIVSDFFSASMNDINSAQNALKKMQSALSPLMDKMRDSFTRANNELHGLRLVCSDELLKKIDEFVKLQSTLLERSGNLMSSWIDLGINKMAPSELPDDMSKMGLRSKQLLDEIISQMRKELGIK